MRHDSRYDSACDFLTGAELTLLWPRSAQRALGSLLTPGSDSLRDMSQGRDDFMITRSGANWEWLTEEREFFDENGAPDREEVKTDLGLSRWDSEALQRRFELAVGVCSQFGIPCDLSLTLPNGETRFAQTRPNPPQSVPGPFGSSRRRDEANPVIRIDQALDIASACSSLAELKQRLQDELDDRMFTQSPGESMPAFEALWPGDSFEKTAAARVALGSRGELAQRVALAQALPKLECANHQGASALRFLIEASPKGSAEREGAMAAGDLLLFTQSGAAQQRALDDVARGHFQANGSTLVLGQKAATLLCVVESRLSQRIPTDFNGPLGALLASATLETPKASESAEAAELERLFLAAQSAPLAQPRLNSTPPQAKSLRV